VKLELDLPSTSTTRFMEGLFKGADGDLWDVCNTLRHLLLSIKQRSELTLEGFNNAHFCFAVVGETESTSHRQTVTAHIRQ